VPQHELGPRVRRVLPRNAHAAPYSRARTGSALPTPTPARPRYTAAVCAHDTCGPGPKAGRKPRVALDEPPPLRRPPPIERASVPADRGCLALPVSRHRGVQRAVRCAHRCHQGSGWRCRVYPRPGRRVAAAAAPNRRARTVRVSHPRNPAVRGCRALGSGAPACPRARLLTTPRLARAPAVSINRRMARRHLLARNICGWIIGAHIPALRPSNTRRPVQPTARWVTAEPSGVQIRDTAALPPLRALAVVPNRRPGVGAR